MTVNLGSADVTSGDSTNVSSFQNVDASAVSSAVSITGSSAANTITGGSGNDTIDGAGGADIILAGGGNDTVIYRGSETSIDGGSGSNTLVLATAANINLGNADQTSGDSTNTTNFQNVDASALSSAVSITGSSLANTITGGSGNDTIDGGGGADIIAAGGGNDTVTYRGTETSIDGGSGSNTLVLATAVTVNLGNADVTSGDSVNVANFGNVDASALSAAVALTGSSSANSITGGSGNDTIDGAGGSDVIAAGGGSDTVTYRGSETSIDGGSGNDTLILAASGGITAIDFSVGAGSDQTTGDSVSVANFEHLDASGISSSLTVTGSSSANTITTGSGNDTIDGNGGADVIAAGGGDDSVAYYGSETSIDGGSGTNTLSLHSAATVNLGNADQTSGDSTGVSNFQNVDASAVSSGMSITGSSGANVIIGGSGNDTIDGAGGGDAIYAGGGNDAVIYHGNEVLLDAGTGTDTLILAAAGGTTAIDLSVASSADQTTGDSVNVKKFENIDASAVSSDLSITGSSGANTISGGSGNDTINGGGGLDHLFGNGGDDLFIVDHSSLALGTTIDGGSGTNTVNISANSGTISDPELVASLTNVQVIDFTANNVDASLNLSGSQISQMAGGAANTLTLNFNAGDALAITDPAANYTSTTVGNTTNYTIYDDAAHTNVVAHLALVA